MAMPVMKREAREWALRGKRAGPANRQSELVAISLMIREVKDFIQHRPHTALPLGMYLLCRSELIGMKAVTCRTNQCL